MRRDRPDLKTGLPIALGLAGVMGLAGCDAPSPPPATATATAPTAAPAAGETSAKAAPAPSGDTSSGDTNSGDTDAGAQQNATAAPALLPNDPSAPADSPLCGTAAREFDALSQSLMPRLYAEAGQCTSYTCYDAATATYLGTDGYRHVCR